MGKSAKPPLCSLSLQVRHGPQPYAHVKASMVLLPYACSIGRESLLHTLVESSVPVKVRLVLSIDFDMSIKTGSNTLME